MRRTTACFMILACAVIAMPACGGGSSSVSTPPPPPPGPAPVVDIVVVSREGGAIVMFKDIMNGHSIVGADVVIDNSGPTSIDNHGHLAYENGWMAVASRNDDNILIYGDVANLTDQQVPNAIVGSGSDFRSCWIAGGDLYATRRSELQIWRDVTTVADGDPADVVLTGFNNVWECVVYNDTLFAADRDNNEIWRYDGASTLLSGATPDAMVPSFGGRRMVVHDDVLWAFSDDGNGIVGGYSDPVSMTASTSPDLAIFGLIKMTDRNHGAFSGNTAWIGNNGTNDNIVLNRIDLANPTASQAAMDEGDVGFDSTYDMKIIGGALFVTARYSSAVFWYRNPASMVAGQAPDGFVFDARLNNAKDIVGWVR